jgi:hypothetical protein
MPDWKKAMNPSDRVLDPLNFLALEFSDAPAFLTDEMFVLRLPGKAMLVPLEAFAEIVLGHQMASNEKIQGPIHRCLPDSLPPLPQPVLDVFDGKVFRR